MTIVQIEPLYLGRQFTSIEAQAGTDTGGRVIVYNPVPKFQCKAWDDGGHGEDVWFEISIHQRTGAAPPYVYAPPGGSTFNVNSRNNSDYFYDKQYYKSGEPCIVNYALNALVTNRLTTYSGVSNVFALQWIAYDRTTSTPLASNLIEFTFILEEQLASVENLDCTVFDRVTVFRPNGLGGWVEVQAPLTPTNTPFTEPFASAAKTLSLSFFDEWGLFLPQSQDNLNYVGNHATGVYSPVMRLGNRVAYEQGVVVGNPINFGWTNLITYTDPSRYLGRVWTLPGANRKEPWLQQNIDVQWWDGAAWVDATKGNEYDIFQYGVFFRDVQTAVRARGHYHNVTWNYFGMFYMGAPNYSNAPNTGTIVTVDCQDRLSLLDKNGRVIISTCEIYSIAGLDETRQFSDQTDGTFYWNDDNLKTWQDPSLEDDLLLWFYDNTGPYVGNYVGTDPIADGSARVWNDEFEIFVEYEDPVSGLWEQLDEDAYIRTIYGLLINKDWSPDMPWQNVHLRITFQTWIPNSNPVGPIFAQILEYPNYDTANSRYGGPGLSADDYSIPGVSDSSDIDDWMGVDVNRFIWTHYMGSAFDAIKELMRIAGFPYNYRITAEPNPSWDVTPFDSEAQDIITFREVTQYPVEFAETMLMLPVNVKQKIEEDRTATIVRSRVFDDFAKDLSVERGVYARLCWGPGVPLGSGGLNWPYKGGFNRNGGTGLIPPFSGPSMAPSSTQMDAVRGGDGDSAELEVDITDLWKPMAPGTATAARGFLTDGNIFTHIRHRNDSKDWGLWPEFIPTPVAELTVPFQLTKGGIGVDNPPIDLAAIDFRNQEVLNYLEYGEWASNQHIGIRYGRLGDKTSHGNVRVVGNVVQGILPGVFETNELVGAVLEVGAGLLVNNIDVSNTYPIIANDGPLGTITVEIRDLAYFTFFGWGTMQAQLGVGANAFNAIVRNYKWLPNFNRKICPIQSTTSWELDGYTLNDVRYLEIWCIKPGASSMYETGGSALNDQFLDIGNLWIYDGSISIGKPVYMRIRDTEGEVPDESEDIVDYNDEFFREDLVNRLGIRTNVLHDDKSLVDFDDAFERAGQALYENLVVEDTYEVDGIYFPHIPRYSTILLNVESMGIAFPALVESRSCTISGTKQNYRWVLRNYNNLIWPHPFEPDYS